MEKSISPGEESSILSVLGRFALLGTVYVAIAWATIVFIQDRAFPSIFESYTPAFYQLLIGTIAGAAFGIVQRILLFKWKRWQAMQASAISSITSLIRTPATIILVSIIVGVSEEILFRAAIQPLSGILIASVLFTAVHLNLDNSVDMRSDSRMALFSVYMVFVVSLLMGFLFGSFGLIASISGHIVYDAIVLLSYRSLFAWLSQTPGNAA